MSCLGGVEKGRENRFVKDEVKAGSVKLVPVLAIVQVSKCAPTIL